MKMYRKAVTTLGALALLCSMQLSAEALDYQFSEAELPEYYPSTSYENRYGAAYQYGGPNGIDFEIPELPYGRYVNTATGAMEKVQIPSQSVSLGGMSIDVGGVIEPPEYPLIYQKPSYTSVQGMYLSDGSIGTVKIPSLAISLKVWEGETTASMSKGLGHYTSTSGWDGNVGVCGHNRGTKYNIGEIIHLKKGDTITYTTVYGTRTYAVTYVGKILNNDWSYLQGTFDNRITLTTCLANQPEYRVCVQAIEI